jgi:16S rRNA (adenine1518-N6/adenine1519-N6)-dimethyltransferase
MNLYDINTIKKILSKYGFTFSKALGQNFLIDPDVCPNMAKELNANGKTGVLEIGPGIGVLTKELCKAAKKVVAVRIKFFCHIRANIRVNQKVLTERF